tara:strand:- start:1012 stop:1230 length:219 start_codon:yes stop_codon:yes gene_type:complete
MVMETVQIRLSKGIIERIDTLIKDDLYSSRSEVIRDAVRRMTLKLQIGSIPNTGDSVKEVRKFRNKISKNKR